MIIEKPIKSLTIQWELSDICNYNYSYCFVKHSPRQDAYPSMEKILSNAKSLHNFIEYNSDTKYVVQIIGGEPSLLDLDKVLNVVNAKNIAKFRINTNLSNTAEFYTYLRSKYPIVISASFHENFCSIEDFLKKYIDLKSKGCEILCNFVMTNDNENTFKILKTVMKDDVRVSFEFDEKKNLVVSDQIIQKYRKFCVKNLKVDSVKDLQDKYFLRSVDTTNAICHLSSIKIYPNNEMWLGTCKNCNVFLGELGKDLFKWTGMTHVCSGSYKCGGCGLRKVEIVKGEC